MAAKEQYWLITASNPEISFAIKGRIMDWMFKQIEDGWAVALINHLQITKDDYEEWNK